MEELEGGEIEMLVAAHRVHTFPASVTSRNKWGDVEHDRATGYGRAYDALLGSVQAEGEITL